MGSRALKNRRGVIKRSKARVLVVILGLMTLLAIIAGFAAFATAHSWLDDLPEYENASAYNYAEKTRVYANDGTTLLAEFYLEDREPISQDAVSPYVWKGTVATEDVRFYDHAGIDPQGIARAAFVNITGLGTEGGSTITQQFVRNTVLSDEAADSTLKRKVREMYISLKLEERYSKDEILLMYLNTINYGQGAYGIEAASQLYFGKHANELSVAEAATLIGIPQSPNYNNPVDNPTACVSRRNVVLDRMLTNGVINQAQYDEAKATPLQLNLNYPDTSNDGIYAYPYFTSYVRQVLLSDYTSAEVFKGGMTVKTTLDIPTQIEAERAAAAKVADLDTNIECALTAVDPDTGFIKAIVGGRDYYANQYNLATQAMRQPGSSFKTYTLLTAIENGVNPSVLLDCSSYVTIDGWTVENDGASNYGTKTLAGAFAVSSNTGFARMVTYLGPEKVAEMAQRCGVDTELEAVPSITLGSQGVTTRDMAGAYATIASGGIAREATPIEVITDSAGRTIYRADTQGTQVIAPEVAAAATSVMEGVLQSGGTGTDASLPSGQPAAGKTGTSENYRDSYFCGITPQLSVAIWLGGRQEVEMDPYLTAASVFRDFTGSVLANQPIEQFKTAGLINYTVNDLGLGSGSWTSNLNIAAPAPQENAEEQKYFNFESDGKGGYTTKDAKEEQTKQSQSSSNSSSSSGEEQPSTEGGTTTESGASIPNGYALDSDGFYYGESGYYDSDGKFTSY